MKSAASFFLSVAASDRSFFPTRMLPESSSMFGDGAFASSVLLYILLLQVLQFDTFSLLQPLFLGVCIPVKNS